MSIHAVTAFVIDCDARDCVRQWTGGADETTDETRYEASGAGWIYDGGDLCPEHAHLEEKS